LHKTQGWALGEWSALPERMPLADGDRTRRGTRKVGPMGTERPGSGERSFSSPRQGRGRWAEFRGVHLHLATRPVVWGPRPKFRAGARAGFRPRAPGCLKNRPVGTGEPERPGAGSSGTKKSWSPWGAEARGLTWGGGTKGGGPRFLGFPSSGRAAGCPPRPTAGKGGLSPHGLGARVAFNATLSARPRRRKKCRGSGQGAWAKELLGNSGPYKRSVRGDLWSNRGGRGPRKGPRKNTVRETRGARPAARAPNNNSLYWGRRTGLGQPPARRGGGGTDRAAPAGSGWGWGPV